jgi:hypothetical protein
MRGRYAFYGPVSRHRANKIDEARGRRLEVHRASIMETRCSRTRRPMGGNR